MGSVVGERLTCIIEYGLQHHLPVVIVSASGGARMQESVLSLMQMAKTSAALAKLHEKRLPYISILTNPTGGGVTASFASLGDILVAEPDALVCFAGTSASLSRSSSKSCHQVLKGQNSFLIKGIIDCIVNRHELKDKLSLFLNFLLNNEREFDNCPSEKEDEDLSVKLKELMKIVDQKLQASPA
jgi:acetyl-CoA carboxylase carboxyl transferase subunit beta